MIAPAAPQHPDGADASLRGAGGRFLIAFYHALRTIKLHPRMYTRISEEMDELSASAQAITELDGVLELRIDRELLFMNDTRLRSDLGNFASFGYVTNILVASGVGVLSVSGRPTGNDWRFFLSQLLRVHEMEAGDEAVHEIQEHLLERAIASITVGPPIGGQFQFPGELDRKQAAQRTYQRSVPLTKELFTTARMGRVAQAKQVKHAVQGIVDQVLSNEVSLVGLTTLSEFDDYSFTHSVNVCIFSVAIGKRLGLSKRQLFDLGHAALLHDVGMSRLPVETVTKEGDLTEEEWATMRSHTWLGALKIFHLRDYGELPLRSMITAYEHHMKVNLSGYPRSIRPREISIFSKIISVADVFDAATSKRNHMAAKSPDVILHEIWKDPGLGYDPVLVKAMVNLLGVYPVGTLVILDTFELAVVLAPNSDAAFIHRPVVRIISSADGRWTDDATPVDLADTATNGTFLRSIIKVTEPDKYAITISDYFV